MVVAPLAMVPPQGNAQGQAATVHAELAYVPESVPFVQVRVCDVHVAPQATDEVE